VLEIKFYGRGGQGAVLASQILARAFFKLGMYPQCFSIFGGERRGAPVESFLRVDEKRIRLRCGIKNPHHLILMSPDLITPEVLSAVRKGGMILVNAETLPETVKGVGECDIALIDAQGIADRVGLGRALNTAVLGSYCRVHGGIPLHFLEEAIKEIIPSRIDENIEAARIAYQEVSIYRRSKGNGA